MAAPSLFVRMAPSGPVTSTGGGGVDSVTGIDGIVASPTTGAVVVSGAALLPLDGSRSMTGNLNMGTQDITNVGTLNGVGITAAGGGTLFLADDGMYKAPPGGVSDVTGINGITVAPTTGSVVVNGNALLPVDGTRPMTGDLNMGTNNINSVGTVNGVPLTAAGGGTLFLANDGTYKTTPAAPVTDVTGSNDISVSPTTGNVIVSGAALLPLSGSRAMTGPLNMGSQNISNAAAVSATTFNGVALSTAAGATNFLAGDGTYKAVAGQVTSIQNVDYNQCVTQNLAGGTCYFALMVAMEDMVLANACWDLAVSSAGNFQLGVYEYPSENILVASSPAAYTTSGIISANFTATTSVSKYDKFWLALWVSASPQAKVYQATGADGIRSQLAGQPNLPVSFTVNSQTLTPWMAVGVA